MVPRPRDNGRLAFFIVYFVWQPNWRETVHTLRSQVGIPHPKMAVMIDVESWGGQIRGDYSAELNATYREVGAFVGSRAKVIGYGTVEDLNTLWPHKPPGLRIVVAAYGRNPPYPGKLAHQFTDGSGYGGGSPEGATPFGNCDMNSADGLPPDVFAGACGIRAREVRNPGQGGHAGANLNT